MEVAHLLDTRYADCETVTLVCDNLNTHTKGAFYEAFPPEKARDYVRRLNFVLHAQARQLAERGGMRTELPDQPMPAGRRIGELERTAIRNRHLVRQNQRQTTRRRLAIPHRRRPHETQTTLPQNQGLTGH